MRPNIFKITEVRRLHEKFFTWLLQWADEGCTQYDAALHAVALDFVRLLLDEGPEYPIEQIIIEDPPLSSNEGFGEDILIEVNEHFLIIFNYSLIIFNHHINRNFDSLWHLKRLQHYKKENPQTALKLVYLDTGIERIENDTKDYKVLNLKEILARFNKMNVTNDIFRQFVDYWVAIEDEANSFRNWENLRYNWHAAQGFFEELQKQLNCDVPSYVSDPTGNFWLSRYKKRNAVCRAKREGLLSIKFPGWPMGEGLLSIGIFNNLKGNIELFIGINPLGRNGIIFREDLGQIFSEIEPLAEKYGLIIHEPEKIYIYESEEIYASGFFGTRKLSRLATVSGAFREIEDGHFDFGHFLKTFVSLEELIDKYCQESQDKYDKYRQESQKIEGEI